MDNILDRKHFVFFDDRPDTPYFNVDLGCTRIWTKFSIRETCQPRLLYNIEIGGGREDAKCLKLCLSNILSVYRLA